MGKNRAPERDSYSYHLMLSSFKRLSKMFENVLEKQMEYRQVFWSMDEISTLHKFFFAKLDIRTYLIQSAQGV